MKSCKKNKFGLIVMAMLLVVGVLCSLVFANANLVFAKEVFTNPITNNTFKQTSDSDSIASLNGWSYISYDGYDSKLYKSGAVKNSSMKKLEDEGDNGKALWDRFKLVEAPSSYSGDVEETYLMINSFDDLGRLGYKSTKFSLDANSYYSITITYKTTKASNDYGDSDSFASIYLKNLSNSKIETENKFERKTTNNAWDNLTFFVETSPYTSESLELQLWVGGESATDLCKGSVFFKDVKVSRYTESAFTTAFNDADEDKRSLISLTDYNELTSVENNGFENGSINTITGWTQLNPLKGNDALKQISFSSFAYKDIENPKSNNSKSNTKALFMYQEDAKEMGIQSSTLTLDPNRYYLLSVWAKSDCNIGDGGIIQLVKIDNKGKADSSIANALKVSTTVSDDNNYRNGWINYSIYIHTANFEQTKVAVQLKLNSEGYVFFDDVNLKQISATNYATGSKGSNAVSVDLLNNQTSGLITNYTFDVANYEGNDLTYPLTPSNWTLNEHNDYENYFAGVVNTGEIDKVKVNHPTFPSVTNYNTVNSNYILAMGSKNVQTKLVYTSEEFSLSKSTSYLLNFYVNSIYASKGTNAKATLKVLNDDLVIYEFDNFNTNSNWEKYSLYISTGMFSGSFKIELSFENIKGYIFFDAIDLNTTSNVLEEDALNNIYAIDLSKDLLKNLDNWTISANTNDYKVTKNAQGLNLETLDDIKLTLTSNNKITLASNSFYKITVLAKTTIADGVKGGARFGVLINDEEDSMAEIVEENGFSKYYIYIQTGESELNIKLVIGLGSNDNALTAIADFKDLEITQIDNEENYNSDYTNTTNSSDNVKQITLKSDNNNEDNENNDEDNSSSSSNNSVNVWMAISSSITAVALIIALIGFAVRKIKWKRPESRKKSTSSYDRRKTLEKGLSAKEQIELRKQMIEDLKSDLQKEEDLYNQAKATTDKQIDDIANALNENVQEYKEQLKELDKKDDEITQAHNAKIAVDKRATTSIEDKEFNKQISDIEKQENIIKSKIEKLEAVAEKKINKLQFELEYKQVRVDEIKNEINELNEEIKEISLTNNYK